MSIWAWLGENVGVVADVATAVALGFFAWMQWHISRMDEARHRDADRSANESAVAADDRWRKTQEERERARYEAEELQRARQRDAQITAWGGHVIDTMARLEVLCFPLAKNEASTPSEYDAMDAQLSSLVQGLRSRTPRVTVRDALQCT